MNKKIAIVAAHTVSPLGENPDKIWTAYQNEKHYLTLKNFGKFSAYVGELPTKIKTEIETLKTQNKKYKALDDTVLYAIFSARKIVKKTGWTGNIGINIGSSRGATALFEKYHKDFLNDSEGKSAVLSSPTTTLGNISSWVADDLKSTGIAISHSITCSTGLHSILNGIAWIKSGMAARFLAGASEIANTPFTIAQMKALQVYTPNHQTDYPCRALDFDKKINTMAVGAGVNIFALSKDCDQALAYILGVGYANEPLTHGTSITDEGLCFQRSMRLALKSAGLEKIDGIVMHATGTVKGDLAEYNAIKKVFKKMPSLTSNKWKIGHTLGASGGHSLQLAIEMLRHQKFIYPPYTNNIPPKKLQYIMVNAVGFGGNAVSIIIGK